MTGLGRDIGPPTYGYLRTGALIFEEYSGRVRNYEKYATNWVKWFTNPGKDRGVGGGGNVNWQRVFAMIRWESR